MTSINSINTKSVCDYCTKNLKGHLRWDCKDCDYAMHKICWFFFNDSNDENPIAPCGHPINNWVNSGCDHRQFDGLNLFNGCHRQLPCASKCNVYPCGGKNDGGKINGCCLLGGNAVDIFYELFFQKYDLDEDDEDPFDGEIDFYYNTMKNYFDDEDVDFDTIRSELISDEADDDSDDEADDDSAYETDDE